MVHKGPLVDVILGVEYQHYDVRSHNAFCFNPGCGAPTGWDYDLAAKGDIVRARLSIKTPKTPSLGLVETFPWLPGPTPPRSCGLGHGCSTVFQAPPMWTPP